jgi:hypothetical protein
VKQPTLWWLAKSQELLVEMLSARSEAKRQGLSGPTFSQYMDERVAIWLQRTFEGDAGASGKAEGK